MVLPGCSATLPWGRYLPPERDEVQLQGSSWHTVTLAKPVKCYGKHFCAKTFCAREKMSKVWINVSFNIFDDHISLFFQKGYSCASRKRKVMLPAKFLLRQVATYPMPCSSDFCTSHLQGRMLQLLSNFIPVGFPQIAFPVFWETAVPYVITNIIIYIWEETESIRALQLKFLQT